MIIKECLPEMADRMIEAGQKNAKWGSRETSFTHRQAIATVGVSSAMGAVGIALAAATLTLISLQLKPLLGYLLTTQSR